MTEPTVLTVKNFDIWNACFTDSQAVPGPLAQLVKLDLPIHHSNTLRRSLRLAREEFAGVLEEYQKLAEKHAKRDEEGKVVQSEDGKRTILADPEAFGKEVQALLDLEVELVGAKTVKLSELGDINFSGEKLDLLNAFVVDDA